MKKHSKMYVEALGNVEKNKEYDVTEAIKVLKSLKTRKFDESVDLAMNLNIDAFLNSLPMMGKGMLGIFVVTIVIILMIALLNKVTAAKKTEE